MTENTTSTPETSAKRDPTDEAREPPRVAPGNDPVLRSLMRSIGGWPAWLTVGGLTLAAIGAAATGASVAVPPWARYLPLAASLLVFGLPHGAVDHLAPARAAGERPTVRWLLAVGVVYLILGGAYTVLWIIAPALSAAFFVAMTWFHWGQGDLYALDAFGASHLDGRGVRIGTVIVRGGLPMLVPLLRYPERYRAVIDAWVALFGRNLDASWMLTPRVRAALAAGFAVVTVATLLAGWRQSGDDDPKRRNGDHRRRDGDPKRRDSEWRRDAGETALLWAFFLFVPPVFAVGVYFCVWHSLRHIARLAGVDPTARRAFAADGTLGALRRTGWDAVPLTAVSIGLLAAVALVVGVDADPRTLVALYLVFISVLTLPHVGIVTWMDRVEAAGLGRGTGKQ